MKAAFIIVLLGLSAVNALVHKSNRGGNAGYVEERSSETRSSSVHSHTHESSSSFSSTSYISSFESHFDQFEQQAISQYGRSRIEYCRNFDKVLRPACWINYCFAPPEIEPPCKKCLEVCAAEFYGDKCGSLPLQYQAACYSRKYPNDPIRPVLPDIPNYPGKGEKPLINIGGKTTGTLLNVDLLNGGGVGKVLGGAGVGGVVGGVLGGGAVGNVVGGGAVGKIVGGGPVGNLVGGGAVGGVLGNTPVGGLLGGSAHKTGRRDEQKKGGLLGGIL